MITSWYPIFASLRSAPLAKTQSTPKVRKPAMRIRPYRLAANQMLETVLWSDYSRRCIPAAEPVLALLRSESTHSLSTFSKSTQLPAVLLLFPKL